MDVNEKIDANYWQNTLLEEDRIFFSLGRRGVVYIDIIKYYHIYEAFVVKKKFMDGSLYSTVVLKAGIIVFYIHLTDMETNDQNI